MPVAITLGLVAVMLAGYGLVMRRRRTRLRALAAELGGEYLDDGWTQPGGVKVSADATGTVGERAFVVHVGPRRAVDLRSRLAGRH